MSQSVGARRYLGMRTTRADVDLDTVSSALHEPAHGMPCKRSLTQSLAPRHMLVLRVESAAAAADLAGQLGPRDGNGVAAHADVAVDRASGGSGAPLPDGVRDRFESSLGADLSAVRVHTGSASAEAAHAVGARAYTTGTDIHFAAGQYAPQDPFGLHLLAHEVAHTVQQQGAAPTRQHKLEVSSPTDGLEREADRAADAMVAGAPVVALTTAAARTSRAIARDADADMQNSGAATADYHEGDAKVQVIMGHTTQADEKEALGIIKQIDAAAGALTRNPHPQIRKGQGLGPMKGMLAENVDAKFVLEQFAATVSDSGDYQSQYAASYATSKRDYGEFTGMYTAFEAAGGTLKKGGQAGGMAAMSKDPEFVRARAAFEGVRNELETDRNALSKGQADAETAKAGLTGAIYAARAAAAKAKAVKKQGELDKVMASINETVSTIMTVGKMASMATTGILAMGTTGVNLEKMVETAPEIAPHPEGSPLASPLAPPDVRRFAPTPAGIERPEDGLEKPNDTRTYHVPSQAVESAKGLAEKGISLAGGPEKMLTEALKMLEASKIDRLKAEIEAAQEDGNLNDAAAQAELLKEKRLEYHAKMTALINNVGNLLNHKKQLDTLVNQMIAAAKKKGAGKEMTGALRLVASGDKFLAQIDLTIRLGEQQQAKGLDARQQRYNINAGPFSTGHAQGPGQLHYWTVAKDKGLDEFVAQKNLVELKASGKDSVESGGGANSTQYDVGKSLAELRQWKGEVTEKRNRAQDALGIGGGAGHSN